MSSMDEDALGAVISIARQASQRGEVRWATQSASDDAVSMLRTQHVQCTASLLLQRW